MHQLLDDHEHEKRVRTIEDITRRIEARQAGANPDERTAPLSPLELAKRAPSLGRVLPDCLELLGQRSTGQLKPVALPPAWPRLAEYLGGGLWPGVLLFIGAPKGGKTQWALELALHAAGTGTPVLYFGLEMSSVELVPRLLGLACGRPWPALLTGADPGQIERIREAGLVERLSGLPFRHAAAWPGEETFSGMASAMLAALRKPPLLVVDHLQLVGGPGPSTHLAAAQVMAAARAVARRLGCPVVLLSNRSSQRLVAPLYPAGEVVPASETEAWEVAEESGADHVLVMRHDPRQSGTPAGAVPNQLLVASRSGGFRWVHVYFDGNRHWESNG